MNNVKNKSLRVFLALCLLVQLVMPGMVWSSEATSGTGTITIDYGTGNEAYSTYTNYNVYQLLVRTDTTPFYTVNTEVREHLFTALKKEYTFSGDDTVTTEVDAFILDSLNTLSSAANTVKQKFGDDLSVTLKADTNLNPSTIDKNEFPTVTTVTSGTLDFGYYLVVDNTGYYNYPSVLYVLSADSTAITPKGGIPTIDKQIFHNEKGDTGYTDPFASEDGWGVVGDNEMGDDVYFRVTTTLPSSIDTFTSHYYFILQDVMDARDFAYDGNYIITIDDGTNTTIYDNDSNTANAAISTVTGVTWTEAPSVAGGTGDNGWTLKFDIDKTSGHASQKLLGNTITIEYTTELLTSAQYGHLSNDNTLTYHYSKSGATSEWDGTFDPSTGNYDSDLSSPDQNVESDEIVVSDFTFVFEATKLDDANVVMDGVEFELALGSTQFVFEVLGGDVYALAGEFDQTKEDAGDYKDHATAITGDIVSTVITNIDGEFTIVGLDDTDKYTLTEIVPSGYQAVTDFIDFTITADYTSTTLDTLEVTATDDAGKPYEDENTQSLATADPSTGTVSATIYNIAESILLPETGGIGTIMFYVAGIGMMAAAGFLIYKRKES